MRWREDEVLVEAAGVPLIVRKRAGDAGKPLLVFFPGGGHRGRIVYGHAGARPEDFLFPVLEEQGYGTIALTYPDDRPPFTPLPDLGARDWSRAAAALLGALREEAAFQSEVAAMGWSMGGRVARNFALDCRRIGVELIGFIGLAATPPLPGMGSQDRRQFTLARSGLWDASGPDTPTVRGRDIHMDDVNRRNHRIVIPRSTYRAEYLCNTPLNMRGEALRHRGGARIIDVAAAVDDQGSFDFASYPLCAVITGGQLDPSHALTSAQSWGFLNAQMLYSRCIAPRLAQSGTLPTETWAALTAFMRNLPDRLARTLEGGHMFFVGAVGAAETAIAAISLVAELRAVKSEIEEMLS